MSALYDINHSHYLSLRKEKIFKNKKLRVRDEVIKNGYVFNENLNMFFKTQKIVRFNITNQSWYRYVRLNKI